MVGARTLAAAAAVVGMVFVSLSAPTAGQQRVFNFSAPGCCPTPTKGPVSKPAKVQRLRRLTFRGKKPGDTICDTVVLNGGAVPKDDLMLLSDTTGSMANAIGTVRSELSALMAARGAVSEETRFGLATYRDEAEFGFQLDQPLTDNLPAVQAAIDALSTGGGLDSPEANLVALHELATSATIQWAPNARRLVAWFGDNPGHEPSCPAPGLRLTRDSVLAELLAARISLIAVSLNGGLNNAYNGPQRTFGTCTPPSSNAPIAAGQATALVDGTNGVEAAIDDGAGEAISALIGLIDSLPLDITSSLNDCAGVFTTAYTPALPTWVDAGETLTLSQCVTVDEQACESVKAGSLFFTCSLEVLASGALFGVRPVSLLSLIC